MATTASASPAAAAWLRCGRGGASSSPAVDLTDTVAVRPIQDDPIQEGLLAAAGGEPTAIYSTAESPASAELLLRARDAADGQRWVVTAARAGPRRT